jgi:DNA-binding NarL/FixJ family response regulator
MQGHDTDIRTASVSHLRASLPQPAGATRHPFPDAALHAGLGVMFVEDSETVCAVWHDLIGRIAGLSVAGSFSCASTAIAGICRCPPDILLLDIQLREGNSMEVLRLVTECYPSVKVIVVTNFADAIYRKHYMNAGAHAFFDKSHELAKLRRALEQLLEEKYATCLSGTGQAPARQHMASRRLVASGERQENRSGCA